MNFSLNWALALLFLHSTVVASVETNTASAPPVCEENHDVAVVNDLIDWIKDNGGIVDDRQVVKRKDGTSPRNVVATSFIPKGTVLLRVPWDLVVEPKDYAEGESGICDMIRVLHAELELYEKGESKYVPYMRYLDESLADPIMLPAAWSQGGKTLLKKVMGDDLLTDPNEIDRAFRSWKKECVKGSTVNDPMEKAAHLVIGYDSPNPSENEQEWFMMIPFYDFYNPREDAPNTDFGQDDEEEVMILTASRDIEAGETIHTPMGFGETVGDERQFIHSGVLERRHSFIFEDRNAPPKNKEMAVEFDLDRIEVNGGESIYNLTWADGLRPHSRAYNLVEKELGRMKQIAEILPLDALYLLQPAVEHERKAIEAYSLALIDALSEVVKTRHAPRPVTPWTVQDYQVGGVNLGTYNLAGVEEVKEPKAGAKPYELFEDFDISHLIVGNEMWKDMIEYRRQLNRPNLSFYVDKVARKRWLPTQGMPQAKQYVLKYGFELAETGRSEEEAEALVKLIPDGVDYAAKPSHHSEGVSVWLVSHDVENNVTSFSSTARQLEKDENNTFNKMNVAKALSKHLHAEAADDESFILRNVKPGVVVEERMVEVDNFNRAPMEFNVFVIWGRVWVAQCNIIDGRQRLAMSWLYRDFTIIAGKNEQERPSELDYVDWPRVVEIAESLGRNKDMFRVDIFVGLPAGSPSLKANATREERLAAVEYAVNESEIYPTTLFKYWPQMAQDGARLWVAGYKIGNYRTVPNDEIPKQFLENGSLPEV